MKRRTDEADVCPCGGHYRHVFSEGWTCPRCGRPRIFSESPSDVAERRAVRKRREEAEEDD